MGYCMYDLTAQARENGVNERLTERCLHYAERLAYWAEHWTESEGKCAEFLKPPSGKE